MEGKFYFEKKGMSLLCFIFIVLALVMECMYLSELAGLREYHSDWGFWNEFSYAWEHSMYFKLWLGCVLLSIICHPVFGGLVAMAVMPIIHIAAMILGMMSTNPVFEYKWDLFGSGATEYIALALLLLISPVMLIGVIEDVKKDMENERLAAEQEAQKSLQENSVVCE